ncbi:MAG TPA: AAA family ATPase, partial [Burkholderiaceae bacterium]|nr:AAA family ATPase [Burkholderiaceae bacterium]
LAGEHLLLIGPPGSAKSELARRLQRAFAGTRYFERLLTRFSTPEELFGPLSLAALEQDRYERLTDGYLPSAGIAFLDEVFKANSAILNALLSLLNERVFDNGRARVAVPLVCAVGASNELPTDEALVAFHDRFLLRVPVALVSDAGFDALLALDAAAPAAPAPLGADERAAVLRARAAIALSDAARAALAALRRWLAAQGLPAPSDRRWRQWVALMKTMAATEGRAEIDALDLWLAPFVVAAEPARSGAIAQWFLAEVAQAAPQDAAWLERAVEAFEQQWQIERQAPAEPQDEAGKLALARRLGGAEPDAGLASMRLVSEAAQAATARRWSALHVRTRVAQVQALRERAGAAHAALCAHAADLRARLAPRLWWPPSLVQQVLAGPQASAVRLAALIERLDAVARGFAALPTIDGPGGAQETPPAPVPLPA